jgi:carboxyl-terminal processing protease
LSPAGRVRSLVAFAFALSLFVICASSFAADGARERREDFEAMWRAIDTQYAYLGPRRGAWQRAREAGRRRAAAAKSREEFIGVLEGALATLRDDHVALSERTRRSPRRVPGETDIWAQWKDGRAVIESVRFAGDADVAGVKPGDVVVQVDNVPVERAIEARLADAGVSSAADRDWALRHVLAGPRNGALALELGGSEPRRAEIDRNGRTPSPTPALIARRMGEERDIGYVRLKKLDDESLPSQLDGAMSHLRDTRVLIVDLRDAAEGSRAVTRALLARFAPRELPWQIRESRAGKRDADRIVPAATRAYAGPIVVLVDHWTAGEGEALAAGLAAVAKARLVGTAMAGLRGELHEIRLPHSGLVVRFPGEKVLHVDGTPRESLRPAILVDPAAPSGGPGDPILYQALKLAEK